MRKSSWRLVALYVVLLAASHAVRRGQPRPELPAGARRLELPAVEQGRQLEQAVPVALREWLPAADTAGGTAMLLLHGSPGSGHDFDELAPMLAERRPVLAPDLPGFGASARKIPDYSIRAHARYALEILDRLGIEQIHVVGFSMGGGVAIELAQLAPRRIRSLTLLYAIGVQELELLGSYRLNHALHALQLAALWMLHEAVPHFGLLDGALLDVACARNFYDSDQRPLRRALERLESPTLILHGERDVLVPSAAAREHHRLVPQSELVMLDSDHFLLFRDATRLAGPMLDFLARVEQGLATSRADADPARVARAVTPFDPSTVPPATGLALVVLMVLIAAATLVSEDLACIAAGLLTAQGRLGFLAAVVACFAGILLGDLMLFWAGRVLGRPWLGRAPLRWLLPPAKVERSSAWLRRRGPAVIFASRFLPGARLPTYFAAGLLHTSFWRFLLYFAAAVAVWTPLLVALAAFAGQGAIAYLDLYRRSFGPAFLAVVVSLWLVLALTRRLCSRRGRRLIVGWWRRTTRWEFWPPWLFYLPVLLWIGRLAIRYRSPTLFTAANPAIPQGGFIGESKAAILDLLPSDRVARFRLIQGRLEPGEKAAMVRTFLNEHGLDLPVVLKPDVGQRGVGVNVVRSWSEVESYFRNGRHEVLLQEYVEGPELGVFYVRLPDEDSGWIFSLTEKHLPEVVGDGRSTVEELILADERAVCLARLYLEQLRAERQRVPAPGEKVRLTDLGTHCRGAVFLDGERFRSRDLEQAIDRMSRSFEGFFFGRYDLRAPSEEALRGGRDFKVLELNGVTSEATHLYDPKHRLIDAYRILFRQWHLAFEVGQRNRRLGVSPVPLMSLVGMLRDYRRLMRSTRIRVNLDSP